MCVCVCVWCVMWVICVCCVCVVCVCDVCVLCLCAVCVWCVFCVFPFCDVCVYNEYDCTSILRKCVAKYYIRLDQEFPLKCCLQNKNFIILTFRNSIHFRHQFSIINYCFVLSITATFIVHLSVCLCVCFVNDNLAKF